MKIVFLDFDGVITSIRSGFYNLDPIAIKFLIRCCQDSDAQIVIISDWRLDNPEEFFRDIFGIWLHDDWETPCYHDDFCVPHYSHDFVRQTRGREIKSWLDDHPDVTEYIIIDDNDLFLDEQKPFWIKTSYDNGLLREHMVQIRKQLGIIP
jgi:hypothetical protein